MQVANGPFFCHFNFSFFGEKSDAGSESKIERNFENAPVTPSPILLLSLIESCIYKFPDSFKLTGKTHRFSLMCGGFGMR